MSSPTFSGFIIGLMLSILQIVASMESTPPSTSPLLPPVSHATQGNETTPSPQEVIVIKASRLATFKAAADVQKYGAPIVIILGLLGNTLSFLVMIQKHNRTKSTCIYLAALAITDNGSLLTLAYLWFVTELKGDWSDAGCKLWVYVVFLTTAGSAFTLVGVTFNRWIAICFPFKAPTWCSMSRTRIILIVTYVFVALFYILMALQSAVVKGPVCVAFATGTDASKVLSWVNLAALPIIPFIVILFMNIMIIFRVYKSHAFRKQKNLQSTGVYNQGNTISDTETGGQEGTVSQEDTAAKKAKQQASERSREQQLTVMLLLVSFAYLIIILPISVRVLFYAFYNYFSSPEAYAVYLLLYSSLNLLLFSNNAINFYLYCLSGSKFRSDLRKLFRCGRSKKGDQYTSDTASTSQTRSSEKPDTRI